MKPASYTIRTKQGDGAPQQKAARAKDGPVSPPPGGRAGPPPDPRVPATYPRRVLLAVTGLSPQVVTETLYALAVGSERPFVPTEIHLVTTGEGADHARLMLLDPEDGRFFQLCREYGLDSVGIAFDSAHVHVPQVAGKPLTDITDDAANSAIADAITEKVRHFTSEENSALHASIAGGRKTMGFYLGYALSIFGRPQDRLSHVLVSQPFEADHQFYYPPATPRRLIIKDRPVHTRHARVMLADIPFVRMREGLPEELLRGRARYSEVVAEAQRAVPPVGLMLDPGERLIAAAGETFPLKPADFAFYWMFAERARKLTRGVNWRDDGLAEEVLHYYGRVVGVNSGDYAELEESFRIAGVTSSYFDPRKANTNKALKQALGERRSAPYLIVFQERIPGTKYRRFGLSVPADSIEIVTRQRGGKLARPASRRVLAHARGG